MKYKVEKTVFYFFYGINIDTQEKSCYNNLTVDDAFEEKLR